MPYSNANGVDIWYEVKGDGPAMVLIHANPFDHDLWLYQAAHFSTWFKVVGIDIRGYGRSSKVTQPYALIDMAREPTPEDVRKANRRGAARLAAVQALYQMDIAGTGVNDILAQFESHWIGREVEGEQYLPAEAAFFRDVVGGVLREQRTLDPLIDEILSQGWPLKRIEAILRAVLRAGAYELDHRRDVPARVVVSEYVDVAHAFVERDEVGMVNAVLDRIARRLRAAEFDRATG